MYSPNIHPSLIPVLYLLGQHRNQPMTRITDQLLLEALDRTELPLPCRDMLQIVKRILHASEPLQEAA